VPGKFTGPANADLHRSEQRVPHLIHDVPIP
jgi:hypothetical protein